MMKSEVGTPLTMAPQTLAKKEYSHKSDLYSLGVIFFQMITGEFPFTAAS